jgi:hypothetical protein
MSTSWLVYYLYELARAMAKQGPDTIPEEALAAARDADREFEDAARAHPHLGLH